jgi:hypothetical protein
VRNLRPNRSANFFSLNPQSLTTTLYSVASQLSVSLCRSGVMMVQVKTNSKSAIKPERFPHLFSETGMETA